MLYEAPGHTAVTFLFTVAALATVNVIPGFCWRGGGCSGGVYVHMGEWMCVSACVHACVLATVGRPATAVGEHNAADFFRQRRRRRPEGGC